MGKAGTKWRNGKKCITCKHYVSETKMKTDHSGKCTKFGIEVIDCVCGCRPGENGGTVLMNFGEDVLDKIKNSHSEPEEPAGKKKTIMQRKSMTEEEMRAFSNGVLPLIKQIKKIAEENRVESVVNIWMSDNYVSIKGSGLCGWALNIYDGRPEMKFEKRVPLGEEVAEDGK